MSRVVVIGGSGHVGASLVSRLVEAGHEVICVSRGRRESLPTESRLEFSFAIVALATAPPKRQPAAFGAGIAALDADIVIDLHPLHRAQCQAPAWSRRSRDRVQHFLHCGTIWVYGSNADGPVRAPKTSPIIHSVTTASRKRQSNSISAGRGPPDSGFPATVFRARPYRRARLGHFKPGGKFQQSGFSQIARGEVLQIHWHGTIATTSMPTISPS